MMNKSLNRSWTMRALIIGSAAIALLATAPGCKSGKKQQKKDEAPTESEQMEDEQTEEKSSAHQVTLYNYKFNPNTLTVDKGATVEFKNKDPEKHNVRIAALDVDQNIAAGESWSYTFETEGEFAVENRILDKPMKMTIKVGSPEGNKATDTSSSESESGSMNDEKMDN